MCSGRFGPGDMVGTSRDWSRLLGQHPLGTPVQSDAPAEFELLVDDLFHCLVPQRQLRRGFGRSHQIQADERVQRSHGLAHLQARDRGQQFRVEGLAEDRCGLDRPQGMGIEADQLAQDCRTGIDTPSRGRDRIQVLCVARGHTTDLIGVRVLVAHLPGVLLGQRREIPDLQQTRRHRTGEGGRERG
jgi:hypothetical protein